MSRKRILLFIAGAIAGVILVVLGRSWREGSNDGGQKFAEPFRIAGNLYFVGANDVSAFLVAGPEGHVLIDGGYPGTARMIMASIARLGFDIRDVKILLNSEPHFDHAGGLAEIQDSSGAVLWASAHSATTMAAGGVDPVLSLPLRAFLRVAGYPAPRVGRRFADGDTIRVGPVRLVAHVTPGHTRGCTSYAIPVREGERDLLAVSACSLVRLGVGKYPGQLEDFERTFKSLHALPADIWVTSHGRLWGRYRKFAARDSTASPVDAYIDPAGYRAYIDTGAARVRRGHEQ
jgi:metallo-beta-lactamase class B